MGYAITVVDINSFNSTSKAQKFFDAIEYLKRQVMQGLETEAKRDIPRLGVICLPHCRSSNLQRLGSRTWIRRAVC